MAGRAGRGRSYRLSLADCRGSFSAPRPGQICALAVATGPAELVVRRTGQIRALVGGLGNALTLVKAFPDLPICRLCLKQATRACRHD